MFNYYSHSPEFMPFFSCLMFFLVVVFIADIALRAVSLWRAARSNQIAWFIALLIFNTMGLLPILYLVFFAEDKLYKGPSKKVTKKPAKRRSR